MKILIIEDEQDLRVSMVEYLQQTGIVCESAENFKTAMEKISMYEYDSIIVDIGLPDGDGLKIIEELKQDKAETGVIIVSAKNSLDDKLKGLNIGADDYITKPFHLSELSARIKSVIRRRSFQGKKDIVFNELRILPEEMVVYVNDVHVSLTRTEHQLLLYFISNPNKVLTKESIAEHLWGDHADMADSFDFIYSHIKNLRKKIVEKGGSDYVKSVYGVGYKLNV
ncbi:MAG: response regulator transcription factor [Bacteroidetes bacterium]|nr:response regulator transcription factor [Bacteroidota bacterium]